MNSTSAIIGISNRLLLASILVSVASSHLPGQESSLLQSECSDIKPINCVLEQSEDSLRIITNNEQKDSLLDIAIRNACVLSQKRGPLELQFRMKTTVNGDLGEYIVYWVADGASARKNFWRIPFRPDGQWHDYRLPLSASSGVKTLRFTFGKQSHQVELADVRVVAFTPDLPESFASEQSGIPQSVSISSDRLEVTLVTSDNRFEIHDSETGRNWVSEPVSEWLSLYDFEKETENRLLLHLFDRFNQQTLTATVELASSNVVRFSIDAEDLTLSHFSASRFPPRFSTEMSAGHFVFCDRSCGVLLDQADKTYANWPLRVYGNTHCLDMPWVGLFDKERGDGVMLLIETPTDAEVAFVEHKDGLHWPEVRWLPSMDSLRYQRSASLRFNSNGGYVSLANHYREHLKQQGRFKTLEQKAALKPMVARLCGAPALWGGRYPTKFIRQMRPLGVERGIVGNCKDPGIVTWLNDQGYLTGRYDNYVDITEGENSFTRGNVELSAVRPRPSAPPRHGWKLRSGTQMYWRSSASWLEAFDSYVPDELSRIPHNSRFIDVTAAVDLTEDYHPDHTFDRRQDMENRRALYKRMNRYGLVLGTEHGNDWITDLVEYFEGSMSGPFWWSSWPAGHLDRPTREQLTEDYLKYGMGYANRVPLWELVYHDCAVTTWYWGDTAGLLYKAAPELSDRKDLFNILYATTPLFWMNNTGYQLPEDIHRMLRTYHDTCHLHQLLAFQQLVSHEFLSEDRAVQRTTFADGTTVIVNFVDDPRPYSSSGCDYTLAPNGYLVESANFVQQRLWVDEAPQTIIAEPGFLIVAADGREYIAGIKGSGRVTTWKTGEDRWNLFVDPGSDFQVDIPEVTGWAVAEGLRICHMSETGEIHKTLALADEAGLVQFKSNEKAWRFVLVRNKQTDSVATSTSATKRIPIADGSKQPSHKNGNSLNSR